MKLVESSIRLPVSVTVGVLLVALFGLLSLFRIPVQLIPDVEEPQVIVTTLWPGASPEEIETEIVQEQEEQLKSLEGLVEMTSESLNSIGRVQLRFQTGTSPDAALLQVNNKLQQVPDYPQNALRPVLTTRNPNEGAMAWFVLETLPGSEIELENERDFAEEVIKPALERVPGVAAANVFGGLERELQVIVDPQKLAVRGLSLQRLAQALDAENRDISAGDFDEGKRQYLVRTVGEYRDPSDVEQVVVAWRQGAPVYVRDLATVQLGFAKPRARVRQRGEPTMAMNVMRQVGSNTLEVMAGVEAAIRRLNQETLLQRGLRMEVAFSESDYIESAISLVQRNIVVGGLLAVATLLLFLRSLSSTFIIGLAIPVSVIGTFLAMTLLGRNINVVSLAGMAFAVGMIVDASIVVLENIYRHMQLGKPRYQAAYDGTTEVWGAVLASVLTTVAVFLPVLFVQEEAGQLFRDIAVAVSAGVLISLLVSITVIPALSARVLRVSRGSRSTVSASPHTRHHSTTGGFARWVANVVYSLAGTVFLRLALILFLTAGALVTAWSLMPETEYLPSGNRNFAFGILIPPPGYNLGEFVSMAEHIESGLRPYWEAEPNTAAAETLDGPPLEHFFFVTFDAGAFMGAIVDPALEMEVRRILPVMQRLVGSIPGTFGIVQQPSIFQTGAQSSRAIDIDITGPALERLIELGGRVFGTVLSSIPGAQARPIPSIDLGNPEIRVIPDRERAAELGLSAQDLGFALNALVDGVKISEYQYQGRAIDLILMGASPYTARSQQIEALNIATPSGRVVSVGDVAQVAPATGPQQINRIERQRAITIQVVPPPDVALESVMRQIRTQILEPMQLDGSLGGLYEARLSGTADKLTVTRQALQNNFLLALLVTYLLMAALFESFLYPFVVLFSVPFAAVGGFVGLAAVNEYITFQSLDVIAMLGFVILIGIVVNNAILIVHQSLNYMRDHQLHHREALREAVADRIRPIFMSTLTSLTGMAPLVLFTGAGSEIYRGLGSVVVGGLAVSTIFTLLLVPAVFSLLLDVRQGLFPARRSQAAVEA